MVVFRTLGYWLLALALIANAGLPSAASAMGHSAHQAAGSMAHPMGESANDQASCHEQASSQQPAKPDPAPMDCCDDGACTCSCLHHAPVLVLGTTRPVAPQHGWVAQLGRLKSLPSAPAAPAIRPPIV
jgi:hypothetical protein